MPGKRIAFVDRCLENFHANVYLKALRGELAGRGYVVSGCMAQDHDKGRVWASKNDVPYFDNAAALNDVADNYMILAPSNPEVHLALCETIFPFGKPAYVDKTFAPDAAAARRIMALADTHGLAMQTSSALRYTNVQDILRSRPDEPVHHMVAWGGGGSFDEYAIHPVELTVSCMGPEALALMRRGTGDSSQLLVNFSGGRTAVVNVYCKQATPFAASLTTGEKTDYVPVDSSRIFVNLASAVLDMFDAGRASIDPAETMAVMALLDAARRPEALETFVPVETEPV